MDVQMISRKILDVSQWITKIAYINLLWLVFSILGLFVFGFFPATAAMFFVVREWVVKKNEIKILSYFLKKYRESFIEINVIGYLLLLIGLILYIDLRFFQTSDVLILQVVSFLFILLLITYVAIIMHIFPVFTHYNFKTLEYIKYSFVLVVGKPLHTIFMMVVTTLLLIFFRAIPGLIPFFLGGIISFVLMHISSRHFYKKDFET